MKLLSTEFSANSVELIFADNPDTDAASKLLIARLPREANDDRSLAWNRYWALNQLRDMIDEQLNADRPKLG